MFVTDGGLPVNGSRPVGGVSPLAPSPWPPEECISLKFKVLFLISQLTFRKKKLSCICYLIGLTNMLCSREDIHLVNHIKSGFLNNLAAFVVSSHPSLL